MRGPISRSRATRRPLLRRNAKRGKQCSSACVEIRSDQQLESSVRAKFPGAYDDIPSSPSSATAPTPQEPPGLLQSAANANRQGWIVETSAPACGRADLNKGVSDFGGKQGVGGGVGCGGWRAYQPHRIPKPNSNISAVMVTVTVAMIKIVSRIRYAVHHRSKIAAGHGPGLRVRHGRAVRLGAFPCRALPRMAY